MQQSIRNILFLLICTYRVSSGRALPLAQSKALRTEHLTDPFIQVPPPQIMEFMRRFGYLERNTDNSEALYHESAIIEALKNVQKYGALKPTGKLDNATLRLFRQPRCGLPDINSHSIVLPFNHRNKRYVTGGRSWTKRRLTYFITNSSHKIPRHQVEQDIAKALGIWAQYSGLQFRKWHDTSADIIIRFGSGYHGDNYPFDGAGNTLAHAFYPYELGSLGGDVHFDEDENWQENSIDLTNGVDFFSVALHELGHSLGLAHSPISTSIMFPYYKGPENNILSYNDVLAMYDLYLNKRLEGDNDEIRSIIPEVEQLETTSALPTFEGDFESITRHKQRFSKTTKIPSYTINHSEIALNPTTENKVNSANSLNANICSGGFDAALTIRGKVHIFKQDYVWKLTNAYTIMSGFPVPIFQMFPFLPSNIARIDAAYERYDGAVILFTGSTFWICKDDSLLGDNPKPLTDLLGTNTTITRVDAAIMWPKNNLTYLFTNKTFWRYNDYLQLLDDQSPRSIRRWPGIPNNIDAAVTLTNGKTYFFKNNLYWLYNNHLVRPERGYPRKASTKWVKCSTPTKPILRNINTTVSFISSFVSPSFLNLA